MNKFKYLSIVIIALTLFASACTDRKKDESANATQMQDTLGLAEYQKWKMESEIREKISAENEQAEVVAEPKRTAAPKSSSSRSNDTYQSNNGGNTAPEPSSGEVAGSNTSSTPAPAPAPQKKGISHTAKGAIVGGASGAVIGAVTNKKNRVGGGVVGGVIGAATGAGVGILVDKKEKKKNEENY